MMNGNGGGDQAREPIELMLDLFVHTPIGLAVMAWKRAPELMTAVPDLAGQAVAKGWATLSDAEGRFTDEVRKARMIGQVAVTYGGRQLRAEIDQRLHEARQAMETAGPAAQTPESHAESASAQTTPPKAQGARKTARPHTERPRRAPAKPPRSNAELPIREFDGLSASQVVSRLRGLSAEELRAVRSYEESTRGRRSVIVAIDRLLD